MVKSIALSHHYPHAARSVWEVVTDLDHLRTVTAGLLTFRGLPSGRLHTGQHLRVQVSLFGKLPYQTYGMTVVECDDLNMIFRSHESGAGVTSWRHTLTVVALEGGGCRIDEQIAIEAGWKTPIFIAWAWVLYRKRHAPRRAILDRLTKQKRDQK